MAKKKKEQEDIKFEVASANIFADIGIDNADEELTKAELAWEIDHIIKKRKLTQAKAAELMGINQPKVSALLHRKLSGFSVGQSPAIELQEFMSLVMILIQTPL